MDDTVPMATPPALLDAEALTTAMEGLAEGWSVADGALQRRFTFENFVEAMAFMVEVAFHAERLGHHPNWSNVYGTVDVRIWSHDAGGITSLCTELAACMEDAAGGST